MFLRIRPDQAFAEGDGYASVGVTGIQIWLLSGVTSRVAGVVSSSGFSRKHKP